MTHRTSASELQRLTRRDQKSVVQQWNSAGTVSTANTANTANTALPEQIHSSNSSDDECECDVLVARDDTPSDRLAQWLRQEQSVSTASTWSSSFASDWPSALTQSERLPLTSGQVKHVYRTRARQQEAAQEAKRKQREHGSLQQQRQTGGGQQHALVAARRQRTKCDAIVTQQLLPGSVCVDYEQHQQQTVSYEPETPLLQDARVVTLADLPASSICRDVALRTDVLAAIRKHLAAGRDVMLVARTGESASDVRLALQQLCAQSLAFCVREQELVPTRSSDDGDRDRSTYELLLQSRIGRQLVQSC